MSDSPSDSSGRASPLSPAKQALLALRLKRAGQRDVESSGIQRRDAEPTGPVSFGQERLWFLQEMDPGSAALNMAVGVRLRGPLNLVALRHALRA